MNQNQNQIKKQILDLTAEYLQSEEKNSNFLPGQTVIPASGKVIDKSEIQLMIEASLDGWLTTGRFNESFQTKLSQPRLVL